jgi:hypothetical protein
MLGWESICGFSILLSPDRPSGEGRGHEVTGLSPKSFPPAIVARFVQSCGCVETAPFKLTASQHAPEQLVTKEPRQRKLEPCCMPQILSERKASVTVTMILNASVRYVWLWGLFSCNTTCGHAILPGHTGRSLARWNRGFESHSSHGCLVCVCVYSVCVLSCV